MRFQVDRPDQVDHTRFAARFWSDPAPFEEGIRETAWETARAYAQASR